jgi:hypothetical protein
VVRRRAVHRAEEGSFPGRSSGPPRGARASPPRTISSAATRARGGPAAPRRSPSTPPSDPPSNRPPRSDRPGSDHPGSGSARRRPRAAARLCVFSRRRLRPLFAAAGRGRRGAPPRPRRRSLPKPVRFGSRPARRLRKGSSRSGSPFGSVRSRRFFHPPRGWFRPPARQALGASARPRAAPASAPARRRASSASLAARTACANPPVFFPPWLFSARFSSKSHTLARGKEARSRVWWNLTTTARSFPPWPRAATSG